jgi:hypothetical protein
LVLPWLKFAVPLPRLVALMWRPEPRRTRSAAREDQLTAMVWALYGAQGPRWSNCLERSLLAYRYLAAAGADPRLVIAVRKEDERVLGHAWVTVDDRPVRESPGTLSDYVPMTQFGPQGAAERT